MHFAQRQRKSSIWGGWPWNMVAASVTFLPAAAHAACASERAVYELKGDSAYSAALVPARNHASGVSRLYLRISSPARTWWFIFGATQGHGGLFVEPVSDPTVAAAAETGPEKLIQGGDGNLLSFYPLTKALDVIDVAPQAQGAAPEAFFIPDLGAALRYKPVSISGDLSARAEAMPRSVFIMVACNARPNIPAYP